MITQSGSDTKTDQAVRFVGMVLMPLCVAAFLVYVAIFVL